MRYDYSQLGECILRESAGSMRQIAGVRRLILEDGRERGVRVADVDNGSGLRYTIALDRGMDILDASFRGVPLAFKTPMGCCHPAYHEPAGFGWLRTWPAGLLTTCGLRTAGGPRGDFNPAMPDGPMGLHGRISHTPAENIQISENWNSGSYVIAISGVLTEARMYGENFRLERKISTSMGNNKITIEDIVSNEGFRPYPLMLVYHCNLGFPVLDSDAELNAVRHWVFPRDEQSFSGLDMWNKCQQPSKYFNEQCFIHLIPPDADGMSRICLRNKNVGIELELAYRTGELPCLAQWKMMGQGEYVMGLEPASCDFFALDKSEYDCRPQLLEPGRIERFCVEINIKELSQAER